MFTFEAWQKGFMKQQHDAHRVVNLAVFAFSERLRFRSDKLLHTNSWMFFVCQGIKLRELACFFEKTCRSMCLRGKYAHGKHHDMTPNSH